MEAGRFSFASWPLDMEPIHLMRTLPLVNETERCWLPKQNNFMADGISCRVISASAPYARRRYFASESQGSFRLHAN